MLAAAREYASSHLEVDLALDKRYSLTRYSEALAELTPAESYTAAEARAALAHAEAILRTAKDRLGESG